MELRDSSNVEDSLTNDSKNYLYYDYMNSCEVKLEDCFLNELDSASVSSRLRFKEHESRNSLSFILEKVNEGHMKATITYEESSDSDEDNLVKTKSIKYEVDKRMCDLLKDFLCIHCGFTFQHKGDLKRHIQSQHLNLRPFHCKICSYSGSRQSTLKKHNLVYHIKNNGLKCRFCSYKAGSKYHLKRHETSRHSNSDLDSYFCAYCNFISKYKESMKNHLNRIHISLFSRKKCKYPVKVKRGIVRKKKYKCPDCDFKTKTPGRVEDHVYAVHKKIKPYSCSLCSYTTSYREMLKRHSTDAHSKKHKCMYCTYTFDTKFLLNNHESKRHIASFRTKSKMNFCSYCFEGFHCKDNLKIHLKLKHRKKF